MGSSISAIYDDYKHYKDLCENACIEPLPMRGAEGSDTWYTHYEELLALKQSN